MSNVTRIADLFLLYQSEHSLEADFNDEPFLQQLVQGAISDKDAIMASARRDQHAQYRLTLSGQGHTLSREQVATFHRLRNRINDLVKRLYGTTAQVHLDTYFEGSAAEGMTVSPCLQLSWDGLLHADKQAEWGFIKGVGH